MGATWLRSRWNEVFGISNVHVVQNYCHEDLPNLIFDMAPDVALLPSTIGETFSYMLSELWSLRTRHRHQTGELRREDHRRVERNIDTSDT